MNVGKLLAQLLGLFPHSGVGFQNTLEDANRGIVKQRIGHLQVMAVSRLETRQDHIVENMDAIRGRFDAGASRPGAPS